MMAAVPEQAAMGGWARVATAAPTQGMRRGDLLTKESNRTRQVLIFIGAAL